MQVNGQVRQKLETKNNGMMLFVGCLMSQQHASVSQGQICSGNCMCNCMCRYTQIGVADQTFYLTQSQYTDIGPASPSTDPITPGAWQGSHWSANFEVTGMTRPAKNPGASGNQTPGLQLLRQTEWNAEMQRMWSGKRKLEWGGKRNYSGVERGS